MSGQPPAAPLRDPLADSPPPFPPSSLQRLAPSVAPYASASASEPSAVLPALGLPRGRGGRAAGQPSRKAVASVDEAIRGTDSDALVSRLSALRLGYLPPDPYSEDLSTASGPPRDTSAFRQGPASRLPFERHPALSPRAGSASERPVSTIPTTKPKASSESTASAFGYGNPTVGTATSSPLGAFADAGPGARRPPLINIGTYLRSRSIDELVEEFLLRNDGKGKGKQIISLGAGSDSRYWRIMASAELKANLSHYLELDFPQLTSKKVASIRRSPRLQSLIEGDDADSQQASSATATIAEEAAALSTLRSRRLSIWPLDLRDLAKEAEGEPGSASAAEFLHDLDPALPTLLLFECVLAYIEPGSADAVLDWFGRQFPRLAAVGYDMCIAGDSTVGSIPAAVSRFGKVMLQNLESRNLSLPGAKAYPTIASQTGRYTSLWSDGSSGESQTVTAKGKSLFQIWEELDAREKDRISRLEGLDEVEELDMLLRHYCVTWTERDVELA